MTSFDYVLVGGGLQNGLLSLALRARQPRARIALIERAGALGGNHTWCFHEADVPDASRGWLQPLVTFGWPGYRVFFPERERTVDRPYAGVTSERFHAVVSAAVCAHARSEVLLEEEVAEVGPNSVRLSSGRTVEGTVVVDSRGPVGPQESKDSGYQKFVGLELALEEPHGLELPILMDARVDQSDGYRFVYVLPLDSHVLLVEDTYFHESPDLDLPALRQGIQDYVEKSGWRASEVLREEVGVLPMPWRGTFELPRRAPLRGGYGGGWFHPGTGYSFPVALRLAELVASLPPERLFGPELNELARGHADQAAFARRLNRMLFLWYPPESRRAIFERFYRLPDETIDNFYALRLRWRDRARLVVGVPPSGLSVRRSLGLVTQP